MNTGPARMKIRANDDRRQCVKASVVLEDGTVFEGIAFGAEGRARGETVFYTGIVGHQEVLTDPAYRGALVAMTYPMIGSYGVNAEDNESESQQAVGVIIRDYCPHYSNFRATGDFEGFLRERGVVGIRGVDTRALTVHLRENGEMNGAIIPGDFDAGKVAKELGKPQPPCDDDQAGDFLLRICDGPGGRTFVLMEMGAPKSLLAQLADLGLRPTGKVVDMAAALAAKPAGLLAAGGGGDPRKAVEAVAAIKAALGKMPVLGVGLAHEVLALALGCSVSRMKVGHHGANHSVRDLEAGGCVITAQHHSFVVDADVPAGVEVTHTNVNDATVEGIRSRKPAARGVQFRPGRDEMLAPNAIFQRFLEGTDA